MKIENEFISDNEFFKLLNDYGFEYEDGDGKVFITETNETTKIEDILDELIPSLLLVNNIENDIIYIGYYANIKNYPKEYKLYSISNSKPKGINIDIIEEFIPNWMFVKAYKDGKISEEKYEKLYRKQLDKIEWKTMVNILKNLLANKSIILCYEEKEEFGHRHILAEWLEEHTIVKVEEL
ncbi:MAG: DUF488 family protein [Lachnospirales bacterium]